MKHDLTQSRRVQLMGMLAIAAAATAAFWAGEGSGAAAVTAAILLAFIAVVYFGRRRSATIEAVGGIGDERTQSLYLRAIAFAGTVMSLVLPAWWLVTVARGDENETLNILCAVFAVAFIGAAFVLQRRS